MTTATMQNCDLIIENGYLVTMDADRREIASGSVAVKDGRIAAVGASKDVAASWRAARKIDAGGGMIHPGFIESHYHTNLHMVRGVLSDAPHGASTGGPNVFVQWLNKVRDEDEYAGALTSATEMIKNGYTAFVEAATAFEPEAVVEAVEAVGIRCSISDPFLWDDDGDPMSKMIDRAPCDRSRVEKMLGDQVKRRANSDGLVRAHVGLYGMGSASEDMMVAAKKLADETGTVYHQHQNMLPGDADFDRKRFGKSPLVHLNEIGVLGPNVVFTHMNILDDDEVEAIKQSGLAVVWHPGNYMYYAINTPQNNRMPELFKAGVPLGFGTDAAKAWVIGDLPFIAYLLSRYGGHYLSPREIMEIVTVRAAHAFGLPDDIGCLEVGRKADIVIRSNDMPDALPNVDPVYQMMQISRTKSVDTVIIDGEIVLRGGKLTRMDETYVYAEGRASAARMLDRIDM